MIPTPPLQNEDGSLNGLVMLSQASGRPYAEVLWISRRLNELMYDQMLTGPEAVAQITKESKDQPWLDIKEEA